MLAALPFAMVSCADSGDVDNGSSSTLGDASVKVITSGTAEEDLMAPSAVFTFETKNIESYTYVVHEGSVTEKNEGVLIYADAAAEDIITLDGDGEFSTTIYGIDGESEYTIEFAFKVAGEENYIVELYEVITSEYERLINIIAADAYNIRFQVDFPEDTYYRVFIHNGYDYENNIKLYYTDYQIFAVYGADEVHQGPKVFEYNDGDWVGSADYGDYLYIKPALNTVIIAAECDKDGNFTLPSLGLSSFDTTSTSDSSSEPATKASTRPNVGLYTEEGDDDALSLIQGLYAKQWIDSITPTKAEGNVVIETKVTELSATFTFYPTEEVVQYGYTFFTNAKIATALELMEEGEDKELYLSSLMADMSPCYDALSDQLINLEKGTWYSTLVIWQSDKDGYTRNYTAAEVTPITSTLPAIELTIEPYDVQSTIVAADGNSYTDPYKVAFVVNAPNNDCNSFKYLCNYTTDWENLVFSDSYVGYDYTEIMKSMISQYGTELTSALYPDLFAGINANGYYMEFPSWEHRKTTLAIATYNEDEMMVVYTGESESAWEPDVCDRIESDRFTELLGNWTSTLKYVNSWEINDMTDTNDLSQEAEFNMFITDDPAFDAPENYEYGPGDYNYEDVLQHYVNLQILAGLDEEAAEVAGLAELNAQIANFKEEAERFKTKYYNNNRLLAFGASYRQDFIDGTATPWDLFVHLDYNAWGVEQMFHEFGPKIFLQVSDDDSVIIESDAEYIAPFLATGSLQYYVCAISELSGQIMIDKEFPVTINEGADGSITNFVFERQDDGAGYTDYYIAATYILFGDYYAAMLSLSEMSFTRNTDYPIDEMMPTPSTPNLIGESTSSVSSATRAVRSNEMTSAHMDGNAYRRTYIPANPVMFKSLTMEKRETDINDVIATEEAKISASSSRVK